jgi:hypothetical protein
MQDQAINSMVDPMGDCSQALLNLVIMGRATPYLHNGAVIMDDEETHEVSFIKTVKNLLLFGEQNDYDD